MDCWSIFPSIFMHKFIDIYTKIPHLYGYSPQRSKPNVSHEWWWRVSLFYWWKITCRNLHTSTFIMNNVLRCLFMISFSLFFPFPLGIESMVGYKNISDTEQKLQKFWVNFFIAIYECIFIEENQMRLEMKIDHSNRCVLIENLLL